MSPRIVLCGYHRHGSWLVFLKKAQVRQRTASCQEGWTPEATRRLGRLSVVMARAETQERSAICVMTLKLVQSVGGCGTKQQTSRDDAASRHDRS
ncbi:hypothetical protein E2C01_045664 [Portunus trituberculatus]|uniref:Uncharacterized protein n=1 Tax=Portunus trituberculatus TaxID=210409 RepID=A0A5B7G2N1_PORTR|nr:hypothetical protein [Portunus trituberculatus]